MHDLFPKAERNGTAHMTNITFTVKFLQHQGPFAQKAFFLTMLLIKSQITQAKRRLEVLSIYPSCYLCGIHLPQHMPCPFHTPFLMQEHKAVMFGLQTPLNAPLQPPTA